MSPKYIFYIYFTVISVFAVIITVWDKHAAKCGASRVPEKTLFIISAVGGSLFMYITMKIIRHKTKHASFMIGIPAIIFSQLALAIFILVKQGMLKGISLPF